MRRKTLQVRVGTITIGSDFPIVVQSMTNTDTADLDVTVKQIMELSEAGSEVVRITVNSPEAAAQVANIREKLDAGGYSVPLVGDFHFNGDRLLKDFPECAQALAKYRINPGNVGKGVKGDEKFAFMIEKAIENDKAIRIGVNWGSLDQQLASRLMDENNHSSQPMSNQEIVQEALVQSALQSAEKAICLGLPKNKIVLSCKVSNVQELIKVYRNLAERCEYPLHLGLTEAGIGSKGIIASSAALAILLQEGVGDTIRISLTPQPGESRTKEVLVAQELLQSMGIRNFMPLVTACPGCGRTTSTFFQKMALEIQTYLRKQMPIWKKNYSGVEEMTVAVMGCVVNGPGESKMANIGISLPGTGETPVAPVYIDGMRKVTLKGEQMISEFIDIVDEYVQTHYASENTGYEKKKKTFNIKVEHE